MFSFTHSEALMALPNIPGVGGHHLHHPHAPSPHHLHLLEASHPHHTPLGHPHHAHIGHSHAHSLNSPSPILLASSLPSNLSNMLRPSERTSAPTPITVSVSSSSSSEQRGQHVSHDTTRQHINNNTSRGDGTDGDADDVPTTPTGTTMVIQGKKNRLTFGSDHDNGSEHDLQHSIKRFCFDREEQHLNQHHHLQHSLHNHQNIQVLLPSNLIQQAALSTTSGSPPICEDGHQCNEECYDVGGSGGGTCNIRHSNSVPDLRTTFGPSTTSAHINGSVQAPSLNSAASSPASSTSTSTPNSLFSQMLAANGQFPSPGNLGGPTLGTTREGDADNNKLNDFSTLGSNNGGANYSLMQKNSSESGKFQYVLGASTSMAIKRTEETMTYLNQGLWAK